MGTIEGGGTIPDRGASRARRILLGLSAAQAAALVMSIRSGLRVEDGPTPVDFAGWTTLAALNALALAGLASRTRTGWYTAVLFLLASGAWWSGRGAEGATWLFSLLALTAAVFCVTDPSLRREHGIAS